jgi:hypothetical protein
MDEEKNIMSISGDNHVNVHAFKVVVKNIHKVLYCFPVLAMASYSIVQF